MPQRKKHLLLEVAKDKDDIIVLALQGHAQKSVRVRNIIYSVLLHMVAQMDKKARKEFIKEFDSNVELYAASWAMAKEQMSKDMS